MDGRHYFKVSGQALADFRASLAGPHVTILEIVGSKASSVFLWTRRGCARHAKVIRSDKAWEVFEKLEDAYFARQQPEAAHPLIPPAMGNAVRLLHQAVEEMQSGEGVIIDRASARQVVDCMMDASEKIQGVARDLALVASLFSREVERRSGRPLTSH